jgi:hypothetical protein
MTTQRRIDIWGPETELEARKWEEGYNAHVKEWEKKKEQEQKQIKLPPMTMTDEEIREELAWEAAQEEKERRKQEILVFEACYHG